jgi:hypothetical protein
MNDPLITGTEPHPLCRSYVCIVFGAASPQCDGDSGTVAEQVCWAVGVLSDGQPHYLGSWQLRDQADDWTRIAHDLLVRGIERLRFVVGPDPAGIDAAMTPLYSGVTVLPAFGKVLDQALIDSLHPGHRPYFERAHEVTARLDQRFKRAIARHGAFASADAACALLRRCAERYLAATRPMRAAPALQATRTYGRPAAVPAH